MRKCTTIISPKLLLIYTDFICSHTITGIGRLIISGEFEYPRGVATTKDDYILVLDSELGRVTVHNPSDGKILKTIQGMSHKTIQGM